MLLPLLLPGAQTASTYSTLESEIQYPNQSLLDCLSNFSPPVSNHGKIKPVNNRPSHSPESHYLPVICQQDIGHCLMKTLTTLSIQKPIYYEGFVKTWFTLIGYCINAAGRYTSFQNVSITWYGHSTQFVGVWDCGETKDWFCSCDFFASDKLWEFQKHC